MSRHLYRYIQDDQGKWVSVLVQQGSEPVEYHYVLEDTIPATESNADGLVYTSRSAMRRGAKEAGCEPLMESDKRKLAEKILEGTARKRADFKETRNRLREVVEQVYYERRDGRIPNYDSNLPTFSDVVTRLMGEE